MGIAPPPPVEALFETQASDNRLKPSLTMIFANGSRFGAHPARRAASASSWAISRENPRASGAATKARVDIAALEPHIGLMIRSLFQDPHGVA
jgi:hypothetical protein